MIHFFLGTPFFALLFLAGALILTSCSSALIHLGKYKTPILRRFVPQREWENLYFSLSLSKHIYELAYAVFAFFYIVSRFPDLRMCFSSFPSECLPVIVGGIGIILLSVVLDFLFRLFGHLWSRPLLNLFSPFASLYLIFLYPIVHPLLRLTRKIQPREEAFIASKSKLHELQQHLDPADRKLIGSFVNFKERVAKEIMVPRVNVYCLPAHTSIREAAQSFAQEGYSRIPVYRESLDQIVGVVLYKDLLKCFASPDQDLNAPLETIAKPVLYAPENKKIPQLLQEFRTKQIHMAIIVDEYGGTEGVVTIEDILEELVGEIQDEFDVGQELPFWELPGGGYIVDAKMTLYDIENQIGIHIPSSPEYETIGGYVFHCAGTIPSKGWRLSHDDFDLEVLSSDERSIKKIKLVPRSSS